MRWRGDNRGGQEMGKHIEWQLMAEKSHWQTRREVNDLVQVIRAGFLGTFRDQESKLIHARMTMRCQDLSPMPNMASFFVPSKRSVYRLTS